MIEVKRAAVVVVVQERVKVEIIKHITRVKGISEFHAKVLDGSSVAAMSGGEVSEGGLPMGHHPWG